MNPDKISKFIYELRKEKGLSQYQLADMIPITRQAVSKWERGKTIPDSSTLIRLSEIFDVSINELLSGERLENNSLKELESTTLSIVDEHNKKKEEMKKIIKAFLISIIILSFIFFGYYYINTINAIKVYSISGKSKNFLLHEGMLITTKQKTYLKIGKIIANENNTINNIKVYYQDNKKRKLIFEDKEIDKTIMNMYGYEEYFKQSDISKIIKNTFIEIKYNDNKVETIALKFERDFIYNWNFFVKKSDNATEKKDMKKSDIEAQKLIDHIINKGNLLGDNYVLDNSNDNNSIKIIYQIKLNQITLEIDNTIKWSMIPKQSFYCANIKNSKECETIIRKDINELLKADRT